MIEKVINLYVSDLAKLTWLTKVAGIVRPQKIRKGDQVKTVPVALNSSKTDCTPDDYIYLTPDSAEAAIAYFEEIATRPIQTMPEVDILESTVRLVVWVNLKRFNPPDTTLIASIIHKTMKRTQADQTYINRIHCQFEYKEIKTPSIFAAYTYDEAETQYLMYPYDYFSLVYRFKYAIVKSCVPSISLIDENC